MTPTPSSPEAVGRWRALPLAWSVMLWRAGWALPLAVALLVVSLPASWSLAGRAAMWTPAPPTPAVGPAAQPVTHDAAADSLAARPEPSAPALPPSLHRHLALIHATATAHGLHSEQADYRRESVDGSAWLRWRIAQVHRGREAELRRAIAAILADHPWMTLDRLRIDKAPANEAPPGEALTVRLEWSLWRPPVAPLATSETPRSPTARPLFALPAAPSDPAPRLAAAPDIEAPPPPPPLPYRYAGQQTSDQGRRWFLERDGQVLIVGIGDVLQDAYRVSRADETLLWLTHIPSGTEQSLPTEPLR